MAPKFRSLHFGQLLRQYRRAAGFSQEQLADLARLSAESIGSLERGARRAPYRETVALLAQALGLDAKDRAKLEAAAESARARQPRNGSTKSSAEGRNRLPTPATPLIGRQHEVAAIVERLRTNHLVTITGSGGVGKTRVAIETATRLRSDAGTDIRFIDLSQLSNGTLVLDTIASALDVTTTDAASISGLARSLATAEYILVLDNCEHLISDVALFVSTFLQTCPGLQFLATSRERLAIHGEAVYRLPSLELPMELPPDLESARRYDAIELFVQRAAAIDQAIAFADADVDGLWDICRRLDGIPLALELAAARVVSLGLTTLRSRLRQGLAVVSSFRNFPVRQQTIRATIEWSYDLLDPGERRVLQRISLFAGGFTLQAAEFVCVTTNIDTHSVADIVSSLVDKSLVNIVRSDALTRFTLLDSVRSFAYEQLQEAGELETFCERHAEWMATFADWVDASRGELPEYRLRTEVDPELENARAALTWTIQRGTEAGAILAGRIVGGLRTIWLTSGRRTECRRWVEAALERIDDSKYPRIVAPLLRALVQTADAPETLAIAERAMLVFDRIGDRLGMALLQAHVSNMCRRRGYLEGADAAMERASALFAAGDLPRLMPYTAFLHNRIELRIEQGRFAEALADIIDGIATLKMLGDNDALLFHHLWAEVDFLTGNTEAAVSRLEDTIKRAQGQQSPYARQLQEMYAHLAIYRIFAGRIDSAYEAGRRAIGVTRNVGDESRAIAAYAMALLAVFRGQVPRAARLLGALDARHAKLSDGEIFSGPIKGRTHALLTEQLGKALAPEELGHLIAEGETLSFDTALTEASLV